MKMRKYERKAWEDGTAYRDQTVIRRCEARQRAGHLKSIGYTENETYELMNREFEDVIDLIALISTIFMA